MTHEKMQRREQPAPFLLKPEIIKGPKATDSCCFSLCARRDDAASKHQNFSSRDAPSVWRRAAHNEYSRCAEGRRRNIYVYKNGKIKLARCIIIVIINAPDCGRRHRRQTEYIRMGVGAPQKYKMPRNENIIYMWTSAERFLRMMK